MPLLSIVAVLVLVGVLLWVVNTLLASYIDPKILRIINVVVVLFVVLWLVQLFLGPYLPAIRVG